MKASRPLLALLAALALATACGGGEPTAGKIAFMSIRDGSEAIYVVNAEGSGQTRLTNNPAEDIYPVWSTVGGR